MKNFRPDSETLKAFKAAQEQFRPTREWVEAMQTARKEYEMFFRSDAAMSALGETVRRQSGMPISNQAPAEAGETHRAMTEPVQDENSD